MANFSTGQQVKHDRYGFGTVLICDEERISIRFDDFGEKKFVRSIVILEKSDREPPPEKKSRRKKAAAAPVAVAAKPVAVAAKPIAVGAK